MQSGKLQLKFVLFSVLVSIFIAAVEVPATVILPQGTLNSQEIHKLIIGYTFIAQDKSKKSRKLYFSPDGELRQIGHKGDYWKGGWKIKNGRLCINSRGDKVCRIIVSEDNQYRTYVVKKNNKHQLDEVFLSMVRGNQLTRETVEKQTGRISLPAGTLNAEELLTLFYDQTVESVTAVKKRKSRSYYDSNGEVRQYRNGQKRTGKWSVKVSGRICLQMENLPKKCRIIVREDGQYKKYIVKKNGKHQHSISYPEFRKGNPYHL